MFIFIFVGFVFKWGVDYYPFSFFHFLNKDPFCLNTSGLTLVIYFQQQLEKGFCLLFCGLSSSARGPSNQPSLSSPTLVKVVYKSAGSRWRV